MTNGLVKDRKTIFINGYAVQWFLNVFKNTKVMIYANVPNNKYVLMTEITLDYIADGITVESVAKAKITEIESL
jgi:hypothetical protein